MQCFIYKSLKKDYLYLYIAHKDDFSKVPNELLNSFGKLEFVMDLYITKDRKLAREDAGEIIQCLIDQGFFVQLPSLEDKRCLPPFLREDDN
jgi:uncharacterized protein YcgL (UPF0745 family)